MCDLCFLFTLVVTVAQCIFMLLLHWALHSRFGVVVVWKTSNTQPHLTFHIHIFCSLSCSCDPEWLSWYSDQAMGWVSKE